MLPRISIDPFQTHKHTFARQAFVTFTPNFPASGGGVVAVYFRFAPLQKKLKFLLCAKHCRAPFTRKPAVWLPPKYLARLCDRRRRLFLYPLGCATPTESGVNHPRLT